MIDETLLRNWLSASIYALSQNSSFVNQSAGFALAAVLVELDKDDSERFQIPYIFKNGLE